MSAPLLRVEALSKLYDGQIGCADVSLELDEAEVLAVVGESGSGKSTLLNLLSGALPTTSGTIHYRCKDGAWIDVARASEPELRRLQRQEWGHVRQNPRDGLRMNVSAGGNVGEPLMTNGMRHYGRIRAESAAWMQRVELDPQRMDQRPGVFSGGMQQRVQIARNLITRPRLAFMDEPTGGLDVSVQARLLDLIRDLVNELGVAVILVTHDLAVARLLADRMIVMRQGRIVETGLCDQVLDDPQDAYTQLLVSSIVHA